jgi:O-antigen/teichoic acid export membrane protein
MACATPWLGRFYAHDFQLAFLALSLSCPLLLLVWLCRSAFYAQLNPHAGTMAGACYFVLLISLVWILQVEGVLSPATAVGCMAVSSLSVSAGCLVGFRARDQRLDPIPAWEPTHVISDHWRYGRWATLTALAMWIPTNIFYLVLPERFGLVSTASLRALMNLMYPLLQSVSALVILLIPVMVRQLNRDGLRKMKRTTVQLVMLFVPVAVAYFLLLAMFGTRILRLLYSGRYSDISIWAVLAVGSIPITSGLIGLLGAALRALDRPRLVFWGCFSSAMVAVVVGIPVTMYYGVTGASWAFVFDDLPAVVLLALFLVRFKGGTGIAG